MGTWYEQYRYQNHFERDGTCARAHMESLVDGKIKFRHVMEENGKKVEFSGQLRRNDEHSGNGYLRISYEDTSKYYI